MKKRILAYMDSPSVKTGFGRVAGNVLDILYKTGKYDIDVFGINYHGTPHQFPYRIWPAADYQENDPYGRKRFFNFAMAHDFDILFVLQDTFIVSFLPPLYQLAKERGKKPFKTVMYYPVDSVIKKEWYDNIKVVDKLVCYTEFGKKETLVNDPNRDVEVIYHGVNQREFFPLPKDKVLEFRKRYFGSQSDKFIFANISRNQQRKDIPRNILAFSQFKEKVPNSVLYLHMAAVDQGWNIPELCNRLGLSTKTDVLLPENFEPNQAYPIEILNMLYNCADCTMSTTLGEGFGLSWIESMACGTPTIMPNNTAMTELITEETGYLINSGSNPSLWTCVPNDNEVYRPLCDVDHMVQLMLEVYENYPEAQRRAANAYTWVMDSFTWDGKISKQWQKIFADVAKSLDKPGQVINSTKKIINTEVL